MRQWEGGNCRGGNGRYRGVYNVANQSFVKW